MNTRRLRLHGVGALLLAVAIAATACGGERDDGADRVALPTTTAPAAATSAAPRLTVSGSLIRPHDILRDPPEGAWARFTSGSPGETSAAYVVVTNEGGIADRLVGALVEAGTAPTVELHRTVRVGDTVRMEQVTGWEVPAHGGKLTMEPDGNHVMLLNLPGALVTGSHFPLTLMFEKSGAIVVEVEVRAAVRPSMGPAGMDLGCPCDPGGSGDPGALPGLVSGQ